MSEVLTPIAPAEASQPPDAPPPPCPAPARPGLWGRLAGLVPTLLALAAVVGLVLFGQRVGWKMPRFSVLAGAAQPEKDDWCAEHAVPDSICVECQKDSCSTKDGCSSKLPAFGWCQTHGVAECPFCHPEVAQLPSPPTVTPGMLARAEAARSFADRALNSKKCKLHQRRLQFASLEALRKSGVQVGPVGVGVVTEAVAAPGEIAYDPTRVARLSPRLAGTVWRVEKNVGDRVRQGDVLALVDAAEVGKAKAAFLQSLFQLELKKKTLASLEASSSVPAQSVREARAAADEAQIQLVTAQQSLANLGMPVAADRLRGLEPAEASRRVRFLGLPPALAASLAGRTTSANLLPVVAPQDGVVVSRDAVADESVDTKKVLFVIADTGRMWLQLDVRLEDAARVKVGQPVRFKADGSPALLTGRVAWVSTAVDEKARTVRVRADLDNPDGRLRAQTFGAGTVVLREEKDAIVVPSEAVHWEGCCHVVFVRDRNFEARDAVKVFHVRKVQPGARIDRQTEIIAGVLPGELVATAGSGLLRSELLKNNLGAG